MRKVHLGLLVGLLPWAAYGELTGRVVSVNAGDSLTLLVNERDQVKVRLAAIDAPDPYQEYGKESQTGLSAQVFGKEVKVDGERRDKQGVARGRVWVADSACSQPECPKTVDVALAQVAAGLAWHDPNRDRELTPQERQRYAEAQFMAKVRRLGLWSTKNPKAPWVREQHRLQE